MVRWMEPALPLKSAIQNEKWGKETMKYENAGQMNFFSEMAEHQIRHVNFSATFCWILWIEISA